MTVDSRRDDRSRESLVQTRVEALNQEFDDGLS